MPDVAPHWRLGNGRALDLSRARLLAIVNATPDSFSDGGRYRDASHAADEAMRMLADGADMLD
ncbi:MAG: dihydropteroate synthase, partial [Phycisphaerales bacterium]